MTLLLPAEHPRAERRGVAAARVDRPRVRIGIINIMPRLEAYEPYLLEPLAAADELVEPVFVRLTTHTYQSSDQAHLARFYRSFADAVAEAPLDGLILTGAPVEELPFEDVHYFGELVDILGYARARIPVTLGLCWGGLVLARLAGIGKRVIRRKIFGVFEDRVLAAEHDLVTGTTFPCAHSRHSGLVEEEVTRAAEAGAVRLLARGDETGTTVFETADRRFVGHLGHPEYEAERIAFEWSRDRELGRTDVPAPANFDPAHPVTSWRAHRAALFGGLVRRAAHAHLRATPVAS